MANSFDDVFIQKIILLATGVPGTVAMRDHIAKLYEQTGNLSEVAVFIDELMAKLSSENGRDVNDTVQVIYDNGFSLNLTTQKIEWLIADSLRQGVDLWSEFFFYTISDSEKKLDKILDNRAEAADVFTDLVDQLNVEVDVNDPLVHAWIDRVDESDRSLEVAKETAQELIDQLINPPRLISSNPTDDAIQVAIDQNVVLTFSEPVKAGTGNIVISNGQDDIRTIAVNDSNQVTFNGYTVTINPTSDLSLNASYHVQLASGVITDLAGNPYAGISDATTLNFNTVDTIVPMLISSNPMDDAVQVAIGSNIVLTFSEPVKAGIGNIVISDGQDDIRTIAVTDSSQVTFNGNTVTINPTSNLSLNASYHVQLASGVITDLAGNPYAGISDATTLNFNTVDTIVPMLISSNPMDDAVQVAIGSNIVLTFSEPVKAGIGNIVISDGQDDTRTIAVTDSSQVIFDGNTVIINPTSDLNPNATYHVQLASGVITDLVGNAYAGINDSTTLNFSTVDTLPPAITPGQAFSYVESVLRDIEGLYLDSSGPINDTNDVIGTVVATDNTGVTSFAIVGGNNSNYFTIDELGRLRLTETGLYAASNDFEQQPNAFNLTITAADGEGNISAPEVITVNVTNNPADDSPIILPGQAFSYVESVLRDIEGFYLDPNGPINDTNDVIGTVVATDNTGVTSFAIVGGNNSNYFTIDGLGRLRLTETGLYEESNDFEHLPNTFNLAIIAADGDGNISEREIVVINVINNPVDDPDTTPPVIAPGQVFSYEEAILAGEFGLIGPINDTEDVIGIVEAEDDTGVTSFAIVDGDANSYFTIDESGRMRLTEAGLYAASNDFETLPNLFDLSITATDGDGNTSEPEVVTIEVENNLIDDDITPPILVTIIPPDGAIEVPVGIDIELTFNETVMAGSGNIIIDEVVEDIVFRHEIPVTDSTQVIFSGSTVTIDLPDVFLNENRYYYLEFDSSVITDLEGNSYVDILSFRTVDTIAPILEPGVFSYVESVLGEDLDPDGPINDTEDVIGIVSAFDNFGVTSFSIESGNEAGYFAIDGQGRLTLTAAGLFAASNNFEQDDNTYSFNIVATDEAGNRGEGTVTINVENNLDDDSTALTLTIFQDNISGTVGNDIFYGPNVEGRDTLQSFDFVDGSSGMDVAYFWLGEGGVTAPTIQNIEQIYLTNLSDGDVALDMSNLAGVDTIYTESNSGPLTVTNLGYIPSLALFNTYNDVTVNFIDAALASEDDSMSITLADTINSIAINNTDVGTVEEINLIVGGSTQDITLGGSALNSTHTLTIVGGVFGEDGVSDFNLATIGLAGLLMVDASSSFGNNTLDLSNITNNLWISGGSGDHIITSGVGADSIYGGDGNDTLWGAISIATSDLGDHIDGGAGNDIIGSSYGDDFILGGAGNDNLYGDEGDDTIDGGDGNDLLRGDWSWGLDPNGNDILYGGNGDDTIIGGLGADTIIGGLGADVLDGNAGAGDSTFEIDTFQFSALDSLNTTLDHVYLGVNDILDLPIDITTVNQLNSIPSTGTNAESLAADIATLVNNAGTAFDQSGDTIVFKLDGPSVAGENVYYVVQNQGNDSLYDPTADTVIALIGHPPDPVPGVFDFVYWSVANGNLKLDHSFFIIN